MKKKQRIRIQNSYKANLDDKSIASINIETDYKPTKPLLHKKSRFLLVLSGKGKIKIQSKVHEMKAGTMISLLPWQISEIIEVEEALCYYLLVYNFDFINQITKRDLNINNENFDLINKLYLNNSIMLSDENYSKMINNFEDIKNEIGIECLEDSENKSNYQSIYLLAKLTEILITFLRNIGEVAEDASHALKKENIFKYMYLNSSSNINLEKISKVFLMSPSSISTYIHEITGYGFYDLLNEMRISKAKFLLLHTNLTLEEVAKLLRFYDNSQLSKIFTENLGISPKRYKIAHQIIDSISNARLEERAMEIIDFIAENYNTDIDILDISRTFSISARAINEILKYYIEQNFTNFINSLRINKACDLLLNTSYTITEISSMVGYNSTKTFNRNFFKNLSLTPSEFRSGVKEQKS